MATKEYFPEIGKIKFEGKESKNPMAFRYYDAEKVILGKKMKDFRAEARLTAETYEEFAALLAERIELKDPDRPEVSVVLRKGHGIVEVDFGEYAIWRDRL